MLALGARLVCDDLTVLRRTPHGIDAECPPGGLEALELRGLGLVAMDLVGPVPLAAVVVFGPFGQRLPRAEHVMICGRPIRLLRHPVQPDLAAKLILWLGTKRVLDPD